VTPTLPHDADAEQIILANCFLAGSRAPLGDLGPQDFYSAQNAKIAQAIIALAEANQPINFLEVVRQLDANNNGVPASYVSGLTDGVPEVKDFKPFWGRITTRRQERGVMWEANALARAAESGESAVQIVERAEQLAAHGKPKEKKKDKRAYPDFPKEALLGGAELYVRAHTDATEANDNYHVAFFFAAVGALLGRTVYVQKGRRVYPNLFTVVVGKSGARKGTAQNFALSFIREIEQKIYITESIDSREGLIQDAATGQKIFEDTGYQGELRMILSLEEFRSFVEKSEQKGTKSIVPELCLWYDCPMERSNKSISHPCKVKEPTLNIFAGTSPSFLENLSLADIQGGIGNRICWVPGDPKPRKDEPPDPDITYLGPLMMNVRETIEQRRAYGVKRYTLSPGAAKRWKKWYLEEFNPGATDELITVLSERDHMTCLKVAMIYAALDRADMIEEHHVEAAIAWVTFLYESRFPVFSGHGLSPAAQVDHKIVEYVRDNCGAAGISYRGLQRAMGRVDAETFHRRMKALAPGEGDGPLKVTEFARKRWIYLNE
jgi:hypothetical protein